MTVNEMADAQSRARIEAAIGAAPVSTAEPVIAQVDNSVIQSLLDACTEYEYKQDAQGSWVKLVNTEKYPRGERYPRIKRLVSMLTPLEGNTRYQRDEARIALFDSKHAVRKLRAHFRNTDPFALALLDEIERIRFRIIMGDAIEGHKQAHIQKISGAERKVTVERGSRGSAFGRLIGR